MPSREIVKMKRVLLVLSYAIAASLLLTGWFFFFIPFGLFGNDKKTVDELLQKQDWAALLRLSEQRVGTVPENCYLPQCDPTRPPPGRGSAEDQPVWQFLRGQSLQNLNRCGDAVGAYRLAISARQGNYPEASSGLGICLVQSQKYDEAEAALRDSIRARPENWQPYAGLVEVAMARSKHAEALSANDALRIRSLEVARDYAKRIEMRFGQATPPQQTIGTTPGAAPATRPDTPQAPTTATKSVEDRLRELKALYEKQLITKDVYEQAQRDILLGK